MCDKAVLHMPTPDLSVNPTLRLWQCASAKGARSPWVGSRYHDADTSIGEKSGSENFFIDKGEWYVDKLSGKLIDTEMPHGPVAADHRVETA